MRPPSQTVLLVEPDEPLTSDSAMDDARDLLLKWVAAIRATVNDLGEFEKSRPERSERDKIVSRWQMYLGTMTVKAAESPTLLPLYLATSILLGDLVDDPPAARQNSSRESPARREGVGRDAAFLSAEPASAKLAATRLLFGITPPAAIRSRR